MFEISSPLKRLQKDLPEVIDSSLIMLYVVFGALSLIVKAANLHFAAGLLRSFSCLLRFNPTVRWLHLLVVDTEGAALVS